MKTVLFIGPKYMDLYKDIIVGFQQIDYTVDFALEMSRMNDPLNVRREKFRPSFHSKKKKRQYWETILTQEQYSKKYDILFVLDGQGLHPFLFETLKKRNPQILCVNYLFDTIKGVYRFDEYFSYFDKVYTFDKGESEKFAINWLPIYWVPGEEAEIEYDMFGFGAFSPNRYDVFKKMHLFSKSNHLNSFIKLNAIINREWFYAIRRLIRKPLGLKLEITLKQYHSPIITQEILSPQSFRDYINKSKVVIDTHPEHQDGLTARFMWALGLKKKIITTNDSVVSYAFYNPTQIYVINRLAEIDTNELQNFLTSKVELTPCQLRIIDSYRIDLWLALICNK